MTLFFHNHKYIMKEFNNYIMNFLNEEKEKKFDDLFIKDADNKTIKLKNNSTEDLGKWLNNFEKIDNKWVYTSDSGEYTPDETLTNLVKDLKISKSNKNDDDNDKGKELTTIPKEKFEKLGRTIGYRSALAIAVNGDNFQAVARDVMDDMDDFSIKQLQDAPEFFTYAAVVKTLNDLKKRESKDKEKVKSLNEMLSNLTNDATRDMVINDVKEQYKSDWEKNYKIYEDSFNAGLNDIREKMAKPDFEWKDPATGLPPKDLKGKTTKFLSQQIAKIGELGKNLKDKIPKEHTLENEMARLACMGVSALTKGIGAIASLIRGVNDWNNFRKQAKTKKYSDVEKKIKLFKKEFDEYIKSKKNPEKKESLFFMGKLITEAENSDNKRNEILTKLNTLMSDEVFKYYYYKVSNVISCVTNKENMFLVKKEENGWNTFNTSSGNLTVIEDNRNLMLKLLKSVNADLVPAFNEFKDESLQNCARSIPSEITFEMKYYDGINNWIRNLETDPGLDNILEIYSTYVIYPKASLVRRKYGDLPKIISEAISKLNKGTKIAVLKDAELKFKNDKLDVKVPGIIGEKSEEQSTISEEQFNAMMDCLVLNDKDNADNGVKYEYEEMKGNVSGDLKNARSHEFMSKLIDAYKEHNDWYKNWCDKNKENKSGIITYMNKIFEIEDKTDNANKEIPADIKNKVAEEGKMLAYSGDTTEEKNTAEQIDTLKEKNDELNKIFEEWLAKPENKTTKETYDQMANDIKDIINQLLPSIWIKKQIADTIKGDLKDNYWYPYRILNLLTEKKQRNIQKAMKANQALLKNAKQEQNAEQADEQKQEDSKPAEQTEQPKQEENDNFGKIKDAIGKILDEDVETIYKTKTVGDFKSEYTKWVNSIKTVYDEIMKIKHEETINNLKTYDGKDPYLVASACNQAIKDLINWSKENSEKTEENSNEKPANTEEKPAEEPKS